MGGGSITSPENANHLEIVLNNVQNANFINSILHDLGINAKIIKRKKMTVIYENSKNAVTNVEVISRFRGYTHIRCKLETGRTHQIRVHMAHIGHPVLGDEVYGNKSKIFPKLQGQCLLAKYISFIHNFGIFIKGNNTTSSSCSRCTI